MPKILKERRLLVDVNTDRTISSAIWEYDVFVEDSGTGEREKLPGTTGPASELEVAEILGEGVLAASEAVREAHLQIAGMQALVKEKDALIAAKDRYIEELLAACAETNAHVVEQAQKRETARGVYDQSILDAPKARDQ